MTEKNDGSTFFYAITVAETTLPEHSMQMDSPEACQVALQSFNEGPFVRGIKDSGGSVVAGCR